jgi:hypothetical protein
MVCDIMKADAGLSTRKVGRRSVLEMLWSLEKKLKLSEEKDATAEDWPIGRD